MSRWKDYFIIIERYVEDGDMGSGHRYDIVTKSDNKVIATYNDERYAIKQAKFRFKKISKQVEKILLG